ncbi:hypothetical protein [Dyadobacter psychrotolerans]|uniref:PHP domain-containing protein n=1 Tax=Dyadobacter psychrotolerans TaxID=2541721 RepID=A0A4R5DMC3_9BACT|nr:hypothetical protein [Dyadobacter psychrotolerans]TDE13244.1 hypothetical protein E0F88_19530 [Dyadobacter psychrotolerans]
MKCNFHAHARSWNGITNGHGTAIMINSAYKSLKYGVHCVSNYQNIDTTGCMEKSYISAYEHGYNINKTHQLVLGSTKVQWLDYLFPQTLNNKQDVLNHLKSSHSIIVLNHPQLRNGYTDSDFASLAGYDCLEVLNPSVISTGQWDAALSAGKKVFVIGDDDLHNVISKDRLGKMCTFIDVEENNKDLVLKALKSGDSYGVVIGDHQNIDSIPYLKSLTIHTDTITIEVSQAAADILITGQNGKTLQSFTRLGKVKFVLNKKDHYARATFGYKNGTRLFLNPVFYSGSDDINHHVISENLPETILFRSLGVIILFIWLLVMSKVFLCKKSHRYSSQWLVPK